MADRDRNGRFKKGYSGGPGRPKKEREDRYREITLNTCTFDDWTRIIKKAVQQAKSGDSVARKWLADYLVGTPIQRQEIGGKDGAPILITTIADLDLIDELRNQ